MIRATMAAAPTISGTGKGKPTMADLTDAVDTNIGLDESMMASVLSAQPDEVRIDFNKGDSNSRVPSGLPGPGDEHGLEVDSIAHTLASAKLATPTESLSSASGLAGEPGTTSPEGQRVQETLAHRSSSSAPTDAATGARHHHLYIGNLSPKVSEEHLRSVFSEFVPVVNVKILIHHHPQYLPHHGMYAPYGPAGLLAPQMVPGASNYGFVEVEDSQGAEKAVQHLNGRSMFDMPIKVSWAKQQRGPTSSAQGSNTGPSRARDTEAGASQQDDTITSAGAPGSFTAGLHHVFVGDLSAEVNDARLREHFVSALPSLHEARVMWDMHSGKSRGYGFLAFKTREDAEEAIRTKNGDWLGGRAIRVNWANQKGGANAQAAAAGFTLSMSSAMSATNATVNAIAEAGAGQGAASRTQSKIGWGSAARNNRQHSVQQQVAMQVGLARGPMNSYNTPVYAFGQTPPVATGPPRPASVPVSVPAQMAGSSGTRKASFTSNAPSSTHSQAPHGTSPSLSSTHTHDVNLLASPQPPLTFEAVLSQTPPYNTTVYIGNMPPQTTQQEITSLFQNLGIIIEVRMQSDRGYGFVKLDTHENAAQAIVQLNGTEFGGRQVKCAWGKDRQESLTAMSIRPPGATHLHPNGTGHPAAAAGIQIPPGSMGMMYGVMPQFGFGGGFAYPGMMPMAAQVGFGHHGGLGPHIPNMAAAAQLQRQMAAMQAQAEAQARAAAHAQHHHHQQAPQPPYAPLSASPAASSMQAHGPETTTLRQVPQHPPTGGESAGLAASSSTQGTPAFSGPHSWQLAWQQS
ncbi:RNA-binding domain-containing protein [Tilletiaria anomala UBC 951]|uniref:RNA-binding domain-containing protein n=1 Tax=Tilletiaria anomala (strain ATCC 24038 / CBS 436.72 / UBC 951) TaxID=1037660 RepID=A0A066V4Z5_TILAU|nr:RNA-binding domain-containing protein [Tilletiaria anomala UBC 951]KDN35293.1 RNA-binding domain-containing protein [Tilletiaria anomala UBC 951]